MFYYEQAIGDWIKICFRVHCKDELMSKHNLDASSRACPICNEPILQIQHLLIHLAQKHDQLNSLVDKNVLDHLEKSIQMRRVRGDQPIPNFLLFGSVWISR